MIKDIDTLKEFIPTIIDVYFDKYKSSIDIAEKWFEVYVTGPKLLDIIKNEGEGVDVYKRSQAVIAYKAYLLAIPILDLVETSNGFAVVNDDKLNPASTARVSALIASMEELVKSTVESLQEYLEVNAKYHDAWLQSSSCTILMDSLLPKLPMYRNYGIFTGSRVDFVNQRSVFLSIIRTCIVPKVSGELVAEIIEQTNADTLTDANRIIAQDLRIALASYFAKDAKVAEFSLNRVRKLIESNPDAYPTFKSSSLYKLIESYKPAEATIGIGLFL